MRRRYGILVCVSFLFALAGCSEPQKPAAQKEPEKPPEPISALSATYHMFVYMRSNWSKDVQPFRLNNVDIPEVKSGEGRSGAWQAVFVSPSLRRSRSVNYSVVESGGNFHKGVFAGPEQSWAGPTGQAKPFLMQAFKTDSTAAYETAMKQKQAVEYAKKNPNVPVNFLLESTPRFPNPAWRVIWGDSPAKSNFSIYVDASTGNYLETMR